MQKNLNSCEIFWVLFEKVVFLKNQEMLFIQDSQGYLTPKPFQMNAGIGCNFD